MLHKATFQGIYNVLSDIFAAPQKELELWIEKNTKQFIEMNSLYSDVNPDTVFLDTVDREHVYDVIGLYFLKQRWPTYEDGSDAYEKFRGNLIRAVERYGWQHKL